jgi:hypothetical protein
MSTGYKLVDNFVPVPKDVLRKSTEMGFSHQEQKIFWFIIEQTLGFEQGKDAKTRKSIRVIKRTLAPSYFRISIGVPERTVRDALNSFRERNIVFITKTPFPDGSGKIQKMTTIEINLDTKQWITKRKNRPFNGLSIKEILQPNPDKTKLQSVLDRIRDGFEYAEGEEYELELPEGTILKFGEDLYHTLARLDPFHPKLEKYYQQDGSENQDWFLGFELYEKRVCKAESCWKHKDKLIETAKQADIKNYGIMDMVFIKKCDFCETSEVEKKNSTTE